MSKLKAQYSGVLFAGYDLSGRSRQYEINDDHEEVDVETFQEDVYNTMPGLRLAQIDLVTLLDPDTAMSHDALKDPSVNWNDVLSVLFGQNTTPAIGDPMFNMLARQFTYNAPEDVRAAVVAEINARTKDYNPSWGIVLANATITDTTNFTGVDQVASSSAGAVGWLQALGVLASDTYVVNIQDAPPPGTVWTDLITFIVLDGSVRGSERVAVTGAVDQHIRAIATRTGAAGQDFKLAVGFERL